MHPSCLSSPAADDIEVLPTVLTVVAVGRDKNSQQALKWATENLLSRHHIVILLHVSSHPTADHEGSPMLRGQQEAEVTNLLRPYRIFCVRKGITVKEAILEDNDIAKAIIDYIIAYNIRNIVVGASSRGFAKKLRSTDVPTSIYKASPEFCSVYVVNKGKATIRSAKGPSAASSSQLRTLPSNCYQFDLEGSFKMFPAIEISIPPVPFPTPERQTSDLGSFIKRLTSRGKHKKSVSLDLSDRGMRPSTSQGCHAEDTELPESLHIQSMKIGDSFDFPSTSTESPESSSPPNSGSQRDLETEFKKLKLELKQTMAMYSTACKETIAAKQQNRELQLSKMQELRKAEEAKQAEEAAFALAEIEKAKCKAAMEAAETSHRIAEIESRKRHNAERKARRESEERMRALDVLSNTDTRYRKYTIDEIELATQYFSGSLKVGEGGYGPVYRAALDHTQVAIKVLRPDAKQGRRQFHQEIEVLCCMRHPNLVLLLGACPEYGCLVYEYMDNGSLEDRLLRSGGTRPIPWSVRFKIAAEIATALLFLHQAKPEPLVHRDLKPANILLDHNYVSKISDVGLSRLVPPAVADQVTQYRVTSAAGTICYIDPEYQQTGLLGVKSDVYSLGVMLLQIITAKPPMGLTHQVKKAIQRGEFEQLLDPEVTDWPVKEALGFARIALKCSELRRKDRPDLGTIVVPELNRLRNLGHAYEAGYSLGSSSSSNSLSGTSNLKLVGVTSNGM